MFNRLIEYFSRNHLLINFIFFTVLAGGIYYWGATGKESLPSVESDTVRISTTYPGASAADVEYFITRPLEDALKSVDGIQQVTSTSSGSSSSVSAEIQSSVIDKKSVVSDIETAVSQVNLPSEVDPPKVRQFKTSQIAVIDIALIDEDYHLLDYEGRSRLQDYALALENRLTSLAAVSSITKNGYLKRRLKIEVIPERLEFYDIPITTVLNKLKEYDLKQPLGKLDDDTESEVVIADTDYSPEQINKITLRENDFGRKVQIKDIAHIYRDFEKNNSITKVNGHEAILLNVNKNSSYGIIKAVEEIRQQGDVFQNNNPEISVVYLDDRSWDVINSISLIGSNGLIGFALIIIILFLFLDLNSSFWVAMGIPFTFSFTMVVAHFMGYTINNVTLAGVIIVMGMIVDDAIVIAENIVYKKKHGVSRLQAAVEGTSEMLLPVSAGVITTCIAFLPMLAMDGRFASIVAPIPAMVIIMLIASLFESILLLPGHMNHALPNRIRQWGSKIFFFRKKKSSSPSTHSTEYRDWFTGIEESYARLLERLLRYRYIILLVFVGVLGLAAYHMVVNMRFIMFSDDEGTLVFLNSEGPEDDRLKDSAELSQQMENIIKKYTNEVLSIQTEIGRSRRGRKVSENEFTLWVEVLPKNKREKTLGQLRSEWMHEFERFPDLKVGMTRQSFGRGTGSGPIEIVVLDNDDAGREGALELLQEIMNADPTLREIEIDKQDINEGFAVKVMRDVFLEAGLNEKDLIITLRTVLNSQVIHEIPEGNEKTDLLLAIPEKAKTNISQVLDFPVVLKNGDSAPLGIFIDITPTSIPTTIDRERYRRVGKIYADIEDYKDKKKSSASDTPADTENENSVTAEVVIPTPLQIAERYEREIFPQVNSRYPNAVVYFDGEVKDSRESQNNFRNAFLAVLALMYIILTLLFRSVIKPLIVMLIIPFGLVGVSIAFYLHGIDHYGFFALLGFLGLSGVVVNDTIVMLSRFESRKNEFLHATNLKQTVANTTKTRLRAIIMTSITTVAGLFPTVYGWAGYSDFLAEMMFVMAWGVIFATLVTLLLLPATYYIVLEWQLRYHKR